MIATPHFRLLSRTALRWIATGCALAMCLSVSRAQDLRYLSPQSWSTEEGLPQSSVHSILQTSDGYLWIATEGGLVRFDGVNFRVFNHSTEPAFVSDDICCLAADAANTLWIGTADGVLEMQQQKFRRHDSGDSLPDSIKAAMAPRGEGLVSMTGADGARWSYDKAGVTVSQRGTERAWRTGRELPAGRIEAVIVDREGLAWVGMNHGLFVLDAKRASPTQIPSLGGNAVLSIFEDAEGNHWIGTETAGLHVLRRLRFRGEPGLADKAVTSVVQTRDGAVWVGTRDDGLRRVRNGVVDEPVPERALTSSVVLCLAPGAHGGLWVGTPDGLDYVDDANQVQRIPSANGLPDESIRSLAAGPDGSVWAGTFHGLVHLQGPQKKTLTTVDGLGGDVIGTMLVTTGKGTIPANELWVGTSGGLSRIRGNGQITNYTTRDGLGGQIVTALAQDSGGDLWVATKGGGLSLFDGTRFVATGAFPRDAGIDGMLVGVMGSLWLRMDRGIGRISVAALRGCVERGVCADGAISHYGLADGLPNDEVVNSGPSQPWLAANGEIWFPTRSGVAIADTGHPPTNPGPPPVVLQQFLVDDASLPLSAAALEVPFGHARFTMEYAGLNFTVPSEVRYRFQLEGFDKDWTDAGARRSASYTNLPPGTYRFRVEASSQDGVWSATAAELQFRIIPPFYRRWWFVALMLLALTAFLAGLYLLRLRRLQQQFDAVLAERNRMAREIHDTLTQDFVGTSLQLDIIAQQLARGKVDLAIDQVRRTRQLVVDGLQEARQSIWELRANHSLDSLPTRLARLVQQEKFAAVDPRLHVGGAYRPLEPRVERELLRIAQEALTNVLHHAQATETAIELHYSGDSLVLSLRDNGVGFSVEEASHMTGHFGLQGMRERAHVIDGTLEISSVPGQGATVTLCIPIASGAR